jgi:hypothetical protein
MYNVGNGIITIKERYEMAHGHKKVKHHMDKAAMHHEKAAKHHEMAREGMAKIGTNKEEMKMNKKAVMHKDKKHR